ncbi:chorismate-binding protein [Maribellus sp. YY47]|uniref:chorismate-binding protein n=1 Tax=Maribellus sp. YY47 TaxID=2929486 RepID=UPI002000D098|nr:chorismate-binding protein [Maribellus sp. YY47]MCK3684509.1 chorismate-binding protein [Maribellus sp. YY47]
MEQVTKKAYSVFDALKTALQKKLTFAIYRLPGEEDVSMVVQKDHHLQQLDNLSEIPDKGGFLISPFDKDNGQKSYLIRPDYVIRNILDKETFNQIEALSPSGLNGMDCIPPAETSHDEYIDLLNRTIGAIQEGEYDKVVLSHVKIHPGQYFPELKKIFHILCATYPNAFVYLFRIQGHCWMGATPEPLLCSLDNELYTVSLAGTRPYSLENSNIANWNNKERMEQEYVTRYIEDVLKRHNIQQFRKNGPYTKRAGKLLHLRTDFYIPMEEVGKKIPSLIDSLHPTSAVCGMPMKKSLQFIKSMEKHHREYYAGYLGPVGIDKELRLFVNLRCMKVLENQLALYVGGGITSDSVAEEEWEETEIKADTLLSILHQIQ